MVLIHTSYFLWFRKAFLCPFLQRKTALFFLFSLTPILTSSKVSLIVFHLLFHLISFFTSFFASHFYFSFPKSLFSFFILHTRNSSLYATACKIIPSEFFSLKNDSVRRLIQSPSSQEIHWKLIVHPTFSKSIIILIPK